MKPKNQPININNYFGKGGVIMEVLTHVVCMVNP